MECHTIWNVQKRQKTLTWPTLLGKTFYRNEKFMLDEKFLWIAIKFAILSNWNENFCMYFFVLLLCFPSNECPKQYEKNLDFCTYFKSMANFDILHLNISSSINLLFLNSVMCVLCANSWFWTSSLSPLAVHKSTSRCPYKVWLLTSGQLLSHSNTAKIREFGLELWKRRVWKY